jgi:hypothetical protein
MSLDYLDQKLEAVRARASTVQGNLTATRRAINSDDSLSQTGKDEAVKAAVENARNTMTALRQEEDGLASDKRASLQRTVSGSVGSDSASIISYRDAQDRADKLESRDEANRLMNRALSSDDKSLASAVAQAAIAKGWNDVYEPYAAQNPTIAEAVKDLAQLNNYFNDMIMTMNRAMAYSIG